MKEAKKNRRKIKITFRATITLLIIAFFTFCVLYTQNQYGWMLWCGSIALILLAFIIIIYSFMKWLWDIRDLMTEYKEKDNLLSGGLALAGVFGFVIVVMFILSKISVFADVKELFETMSALFVAAMPAFIGLEQNRSLKYNVANWLPFQMKINILATL